MQSSYEEDGTDEERYSLWRHRLLPMARIIGLLLATIFIMLAAWLETGASTDSMLDKQMNMYLVRLNTHLNLSDNNAAVPDNVAFGLWKHCFNYAGDWRCLNQNLLYNLGKTGLPGNTTMPGVILKSIKNLFVCFRRR